MRLPMLKLSPWINALAAVQNGWTFAAFLVLLAVWLALRRR
jgi:hypothetical protein